MPTPGSTHHGRVISDSELWVLLEPARAESEDSLTCIRLVCLTGESRVFSSAFLRIFFFFLTF